MEISGMGSVYGSYIELKRDVMSRGLLSCSQVGFNIAMGPLAELRQAVSGMLARAFTTAVRWQVPTVIRADWIPQGAWDDPASGQWMQTEPLGHVLTPLPSFHLLNRQRHHPEPGCYHLSGWCMRQEQDTLPLLRQLAFTVEEMVEIREAEEQGDAVAAAYQRLKVVAGELDLPLTEQAGTDGTRRLVLDMPEAPEVTVVTCRTMSDDLLASYKLDWARVESLACGIERLCLALIARHGADHAKWPDLLGLTGVSS